MLKPVSETTEIKIKLTADYIRNIFCSCLRSHLSVFDRLICDKLKYVLKHISINKLAVALMHARGFCLYCLNSLIRGDLPFILQHRLFKILSV